MRDLNRYGEVYLEPGFEEYQIKYRRKKVLSVLTSYAHKCIVEIGVGAEPLFQYIDDYEEYFFFEPVEKFYNNAMKLTNNKNNIHGIKLPFKSDENVRRAKPDFIICSSLLHEVENPRQLLKDIVSTANQKTVIHINVPNAYSFHRILAVESSIIKNVKDKGDRNILLQQNRVFDLDLLIRMVEECGLKVVERGSYFIKPFTHEQMQKMLDEKIINDQILDGLYKMTEHFSDYGSEIYVNATL